MDMSSSNYVVYYQSSTIMRAVSSERKISFQDSCSSDLYCFIQCVVCCLLYGIIVLCIHESGELQCCSAACRPGYEVCRLQTTRTNILPGFCYSNNLNWSIRDHN